jgi:hypothetical protein
LAFENLWSFFGDPVSTLASNRAMVDSQVLLRIGGDNLMASGLVSFLVLVEIKDHQSQFNQNNISSSRANDNPYYEDASASREKVKFTNISKKSTPLRMVICTCRLGFSSVSNGYLTKF